MSASTQSMAAKHEQGMMTSASAHDEGVDVDQLEAEYAGMLAGVRGVYRSGKTQSAAWRIAQLKQLRRGMVECKDEIVAAMAADLGRSKFEATMLEVASVLGEIDFLVANVETWMAPTRVSHPLAVQPGSSYIYTEPKGVVLVLAPWNYPTNLAIMGVAGALVAGNCVVLKPSEVCTASAIVTEKIITKYLDNECVKVVQGAVPETTALLRLRWDHILYTGNGGVGRIVATAAAKHLTPVTLELGGKSPCIVDGSAKIATAAKRIMNTKLLNCGQTCVAPDYVLATDSTLDKLIPALTSTVESFFGSDPMASDSFARIVNHRHFDRIMRLIDPSSHGGQVLCGGPDLADRDSKYIPPTIILNPRLDSPLMTEEIFGCVLPICTVGSMQEAIDFTRDRETPLALYVFAEDQAVIDTVLAGTESGGVTVNDCVYHLATPSLPFGGKGASGMGCYHGEFGFAEFSHKKSVMMRSTWLDPGMRYPPFSDKKADQVFNFVKGEPMSAQTKNLILGIGATALGLAFMSKM